MTEWDVIVLDVDGGDRLERCLESFGRQSHPPARVIVVDNGSMVPVERRLPPMALEISVVRHATNLGFTGGVNAGWRETSAPLVALVNNDVRLEQRWGETLVRALRREARLAAVQSIVVNPEGRVDGAGIAIDSGCYRQLGHGLRLDQLTEEPWGVSATAAIYRREAVEAVSADGSVLEPAFFAYYEDVDLAARLAEGGWRMGLIREPLAVHEGSASEGLLGTRARYLRTRNRYLVQRRHPQVGRRGALIREDLRIMARLATKGRLRLVGATLRGLIVGLAARTSRPS